MSIFNFGEVFEHLKGDMAKARARRSSDEKLVAGYVDRLKRARIDRAAFESVFEELKLDDRLKAADVIAIAQQWWRQETVVKSGRPRRDLKALRRDRALPCQEQGRREGATLVGRRAL